MSTSMDLALTRSPSHLKPNTTAATLPPELWAQVWHGLDKGFFPRGHPEVHMGGACKCGKLKFKVDGTLAAAFLCHCHMCRRYWSQDTPTQTLWIQPETAVTFTDGVKHLKTWQVDNLSHNLRGSATVSFCSACGTNINVNFSDPNGTFTLMWPNNFAHEEWGDMKTGRGAKARHGFQEIFRPRFHAHYENRSFDSEDTLPKLADIWLEGMPLMNNTGDIVGKITYPLPGFENGWENAPKKGYFGAGLPAPSAPKQVSTSAASSPLQRARRVVQHIVPDIVSSELSLISETENIRYERTGRVAVITLVRTKALNALCNALMADMGAALKHAEADENCGCVVITGGGRAFAAGADIKEMAPLDFQAVTSSDPFAAWTCVADCRLPVIAAVNGFAFGGGCELAMMCDIILASDKAVFGQPEIKLGIIPGAGGTQRLIRAVGKSKAMALILTGRNMSAIDAEKAGLVAEVVPHDTLIPTAMKMATEIAGFGRLSTTLGKEAVNVAYETTQKTGLQVEKRLFYSLFGTDDKKEGMDAFVTKRKAAFTHK